MTHLKTLDHLKHLLISVNFIAVTYNAGLYLFATKYITTNHLSHALLEHLTAIPAPPEKIFWFTILSFSLLLVVMQLRNQLARSNAKHHEVLLGLEILLLLLTFIWLQSTYNGLILLVFLDIFYSYTDFYRLNKKRYWLLFLTLTFGTLLLSNSDILALVVRVASLDAYLDFFPANIRLTTLFIKNLLVSLNMVIFIISLVTYIMYSVDENHKIEEELSMVAQVNQELNSYVAISEKIVADRERKRIAREIHDSLGHALTGISAGIDAVMVLVDLDPGRAKEQLKNISGVVREGIRDVRRSLEKLRPGALEGNTLKAALEKMIKDYQQLAKLDIVLDYGWGAIDIDMTKEDIIFRIVQESITNSLRHGHAHRIHIQLSKSDCYYLRIQDDGVGCLQLHYGYGLTQMCERLAIIGGKAEFSSEAGFQTLITIPKQKGEEND
ncbi:sensor histidine kinase [Streptococcus halichoeri]|uniref:sensor histidine kinase n=1 Tax=Streptococcus halichoeri TaxID=254785 RepID=UPI001358AA73|nr:sensor histidine kinase [Streptococcus halichoeri]